MTDGWSFRMKIDDVFHIRGRGTVVTGVVSQGTLKEGDIVTLVGENHEKQVQVKQIEMFRRRVKAVRVGDIVGVFLHDLKKEEVSRGDILEGGLAISNTVWWQVEND
jgi:elongation factor Tu